ncbi:ABC-type transport auxiliary lipoprotein family protein [Parasphingopyxis marina]|uniref:Membrane integrity-associated transporter subunit PqiC n=1 Tax=Parasphingopyxis marina TaxID=2761622 RepID=A0A842HUE9_9SPHN|nr:ABC-type transport auxiliary lipoprotein family protein [Parasphingopyxis marina]MBC2776696.1 membrane integrity-associated transporter subunit PqiC [Parasphingopyxis marina]
MKRLFLPLALPLALAALAGCVSFGSEPPPFLMTLTPDAQVESGTNRTAAIGQAITIARPEVPQKLTTNRLPVQTADTTIAFLADAVWVATPNQLFRSLLSEVVAARTGRVVLDPATYTEDPGTIVRGQLHEFGLDARTREAVILYDAAITTAEGVRTRRFEAREPVGAEDARSVSEALNRAANRIAIEFSDWLAV